MNVPRTLTYAEPEQAQGAADGMRAVAGWHQAARSALLGGISLRTFDVRPQRQRREVQGGRGRRRRSGQLLSMGARFLPASSP